MSSTPHVDAANRYARAIVSGKVAACRYVKLACARHLDGLAQQKGKDYPYVLDVETAERVCRYVERLPHVKGKWARDGERLQLEAWQSFIEMNVWGWKRKRDGLRRFRKVYVEVPRKNAKSTLTAANAHYMLCADDEHGAEVYCGATTEKQAWEVFGPARLMALKTPQMVQQFGILIGARNLSIERTASKFEPIIGKPGDGASPSFSVTDEYHEHPTSDQYDTMVTGMGAREQPIAWVITTAGSDTAGPCYTLREQAIETLEGTVERDELFAVIYTIDEGDDWTDPKILAKANPNIGVSVFREFLETEQKNAIQDPREQSKFKTKHLNLWVTASSPYYNLEKWNRLADHSLNIEHFLRKPCFLGVDTASKLDISSVILLFPVDEPTKDGGTERHYYWFSRNYLPLHTAEKAENKHYQGWVQDGHLIVSGIDKTDYRELRDSITEDFQRFDVIEMGYDPYNCAELSADLVDEFGKERIVEVIQSIVQLSEPMKELNSLIESGCVHHDGNPVTSWAIGNVIAREDRSENVAPEKSRPDKKIDPAVGGIIALGQALRHEKAPTYDVFFVGVK